MKPRMLGPRTALILFVLLLLAPGAFLPRMVIDNAPEIYFPADNPSVVFEGFLRERFPNDQFIFALLVGESVYDHDNLRRLGQVARALEADPRIERVLSVVSSDHISADELGFAVEPLVDVSELETRTPEQWRQRVLEDRFAVDLLAGRDGESLGVMIRPEELPNSLVRLEIQETVQQAFEEAGLGPLLAGMAGPVPLDVAQLRALINDNLVFTPLTLLTVVVLLYALFRSWRVVLVCVLSASVAGPAVIALLVAFGRPYTLVDTMIPTLMLALTTALLIHLFSTLRMAHSLGRQGAEAVDWAVTRIRRPAFYASLTTALGLGSLAFSPIVPIRDFGLGSAVGALLAFVVVVVLLPPMLARWFKVRLKAGGGGMRWIDRGSLALARLGIRRAGTVVVVFALLGVLAVPLIGSIRVDTDMLEFFPDEHPLSVATREVENRIGGVTPLEVVIQTPELDGIKDPQLLQSLSQLRDWLEAQPEIDRAVSINDLVEEMNLAFHAEDPAYRRIPDDRNLISQYLLLYDGRDLYDVVNRDFNVARMVMSVNVHETSQVVALVERLEQRLATLESEAATFRLAGFGLLLAEQEGLLVTGQLRGLGVALLTIFAVLLVLYRSLSAALLCMLPNLAPVLAIFAIMGLSGLRLDIATALIAAVAIGIAVDDTIHFYSGYRSALSGSGNILMALMESYRHAGRAVLATTVVLAVTFATFGLSQFQPTHNFGLLTAAGLVGALILDLLLLPALIVLGRKRRLV